MVPFCSWPIFQIADTTDVIYGNPIQIEFQRKGGDAEENPEQCIFISEIYPLARYHVLLWLVVGEDVQEDY